MSQDNAGRSLLDKPISAVGEIDPNLIFPQTSVHLQVWKDTHYGAANVMMSHTQGRQIFSFGVARNRQIPKIEAPAPLVVSQSELVLRR